MTKTVGFICLLVFALASRSVEAFPQPAQPQTTPVKPKVLTKPGEAPPPPPGTERVISFDWHGNRVAACAKEPGPDLTVGVRQTPRTQVWIADPQLVQKTAMAPGTCDPAWSPDGQRLAVTAPDGLWILTGKLESGDRLIATHLPPQPAGEHDYTAFSKPRWSPDAVRIAYVVTNGATSWVEVVEVATGKQVFKSDPETYTFQWGHDGRTLIIGDRRIRLQ